ncbi:MAG: tandem-95 repeat protein, partial [Alphaproteobacteria bacterium]|nr:tandem-95 repeat protein [Alphaproteobacteria bacterium]
MTAGPGTIADANGLTNPSYSYRWIRVDDGGEADISEATGNTYTVAGEDIGKRLKVRAAFEDDALYPEARTGDATQTVPDTVGPRLVGGGASVNGAALTLQFDEALDTASVPAASAFAVSVAGSPASVSEVSMSADTVTLTLASAVVRSDTVTVGYTKPATGPIRDVHGNDAGNLAAESVTNLTPSAPGAPTIDNVVSNRTGLTVLWSDPADDGGPDITGYQYRSAQGGAVPEDAAWTDTTSRRASIADLLSGTTYTFEVRALNGVGAGPAASGTGTTQGLTEHPATGAPTVSGTVAVRKTLTASTDAIVDANGLNNASYSYQWVRIDGTGSADIAGAQSSTYEVRLADIGKQLAVRVDFVDDERFEETLTSAATVAVPDAENAPPTSRDATIEVAEDGGIVVPASSVHFADEDHGHALTRIRLESLPADGVLEYVGPERPSTPVAATVGMEIEADRLGQSLKFSPAANGYGSAYASFAFKVHDGIGYSTDSYTITIDVTGTPDNPVGAPEIAGTAKRGERLTAVLDNISDPDGLENAAYAYRWIRIGEDNAGRVRRERIAGADEAGYTLTDADVGAQVAVAVAFTDDGGSEHNLASAAYPAEGTIVGNNPPTSADTAVEADEDARYRFAASDFPFADSDGGSLASVTIETLPASGALEFDGANVTSNQAVVVSDLNRGKLYYTPPENANGDGLASFTFRVNDGESNSAARYTMAIDVAPVNDAPEAADSAATVLEDTAYIFGASDFGFVDVDGDSLASVRVVTLPAKGSLTLPGANAGDPRVAVVANRTVARASLDAGELTFTPAANDNGSSYASFAFKVSDGTAESAASRTLTIGVTAVDDAPVAADGTVTTGEGVDYVFSLDDFNFTDVDGDSLGSVQVETLPTRGTLYLVGSPIASRQTIGAATISAGDLTFSPEGSANGAGYASFTFKVVAAGQESPSSYTMTIDVTGRDDPPVGYLAIDGKAVVGRTLTARTNLIDDPDGLTGATFTYRWLRVDGEDETEVGTAANYTVSAGDLDKAVRLAVAFTDDGGTSNEMSARTDLVVNNGAPEVYGGYLSLDEDTSHVFRDTDFSFWDPDSDPVTDVTIVSLPPTGKGLLTLRGARGKPAEAVTAGQAIPVADIRAGKLKYTPPANANGGYDVYARFAYKVSDGLDASESGDMELSVSPVDDPPTGAPAIIGTLMVGETLTADVSGIEDPDGLTNPGFSYDWLRVDEEGTVRDFVGSEDTYTATLDDAGWRLRVRVAFSDDGFAYTELTSEPSGAVRRSAAANNAPTSGDRTVTTDEDVAYSFAETDFPFADRDAIDSLESVTIVTLPGAGALTLDADDPAGVATAVSAGDAIPAADIGAGKLKFTPGANGNGQPYASFAFKVSDGISDSAEHSMTVDVTAVDDPDSASGSPVISGTAEFGEMLTVDMSGMTNVDGFDDAQTRYRWIRMDGDDETVIDGATGDSYTLTRDDVGKRIKVRITVLDTHSESAELISDAVTVADNTAPTAA